MLDLFPFLSEVKIVRQWAGLADMTPDFAPIMGTTPVRRLLSRCRLGHVGIQGDAGLRQDDEPHGRDRHAIIQLITRIRLAIASQRFELTGEKGAASVGH